MSARAILGMALTKGDRGELCGLRQWQLGPRIVLEACADSYRTTRGGPRVLWTLYIWPDTYTRSTLYVEQEVTRERAGELMRCAGLDPAWWPAVSRYVCPRCDGTGELGHVCGDAAASRPCEACGGTGEQRDG